MFRPNFQPIVHAVKNAARQAAANAARQAAANAARQAAANAARQAAANAARQAAAKNAIASLHVTPSAPPPINAIQSALGNVVNAKINDPLLGMHIGHAIYDEIGELKEHMSKDKEDEITRTSDNQEKGPRSCPNCQNLIASGVRFCGSCGKLVPSSW